MLNLGVITDTGLGLVIGITPEDVADLEKGVGLSIEFGDQPKPSSLLVVFAKDATELQKILGNPPVGPNPFVGPPS